MSSKPAILVVSSHVVRGTVGNRAAVFALEALGYPVWAVPSVVLPWHPGQGPGHRMTASSEDFDTLVDDLASSKWLGEVRGLLSGYLGNASQVDAVARLVSALKTKNPDAIYVLDPVLGDHGRLYVSAEQAEAVKQKLLPLADVATPNVFELDYLVGSPGLEKPSDIRQAAQSVGAKASVVTSFPMENAAETGMLLADQQSGEWLARHTMLPRVPNGLGDLTSALLTVRYLEDHTPDKLLQDVASGVAQIAQLAFDRDASELILEGQGEVLKTPTAPVVTERLTR